MNSSHLGRDHLDPPHWGQPVGAPGRPLFEVLPRTRGLVGAVAAGCFFAWCLAMTVGLYLAQEHDQALLGFVAGVVVVAAGAATGFVIGRRAASRQFVIDAAGVHLRDGLGRRTFVSHEEAPVVDFVRRGQMNLAVVRYGDGGVVRATALAGTRAFGLAREANDVLRTCRPTKVPGSARGERDQAGQAARPSPTQAP